MKRIITLFGTFLFAVFFELFVRIVIIIYQQTEFTFYGTASLPGWQWIAIFAVAILISSWIAGMLNATIMNSAHPINFVVLLLLMFTWRISEYFANPDPELSFSLILILMHAIALLLAYFTKQKIDEQIANTPVHPTD
ncbi:MAG: hypothetical protein JJ895_05520 [Balneolaceae bacterium]|nr:hypothetical protein [Balneolaceae bacterium]